MKGGKCATELATFRQTLGVEYDKNGVKTQRSTMSRYFLPAEERNSTDPGVLAKRDAIDEAGPPASTEMKAASGVALDLPTEERVERFGRPTLIEQFDSLAIEDFQQEFEGSSSTRRTASSPTS